MDTFERFDVLAFGAHPDDIDVVMGGTIIKLVASGQSVLMVDLTDGEPARHAAHGVRNQQARDAARVLGASRTSLGLPDRLLVDSIRARAQVAALVRRHRPPIVFTTLGFRHPSRSHERDGHRRERRVLRPSAEVAGGAGR